MYKYKEYNDVICENCNELNYGIKFDGEEYIKCVCCGNEIYNIDYKETAEEKYELIFKKQKKQGK
jgi:hypothetical protein